MQAVGLLPQVTVECVQSVHLFLLVCSLVVFFAGPLAGFLSYGPHGRSSLGGHGLALLPGAFPGGSPGRAFPWVCFCRSCLPAPEVVAPGVFLPVVPPSSGSGLAGCVFAGRASPLRKWSRRKCLPLAGFGVWLGLVAGGGRW